jgi:hypothetical protein
MTKAKRALLAGLRGRESSRRKRLSRISGRTLGYGVSPSRRDSYLIGARGRNDCRIHRRLLEQYNRAFHSWVTYTGEEVAPAPVSAAETEKLAVARVEETHQQLLKHEQCCPNCKEG